MCCFKVMQICLEQKGKEAKKKHTLVRQKRCVKKNWKEEILSGLKLSMSDFFKKMTENATKKYFLDKKNYLKIDFHF